MIAYRISAGAACVTGPRAASSRDRGPSRLRPFALAACLAWLVLGTIGLGLGLGCGPTGTPDLGPVRDQSVRPLDDLGIALVCDGGAPPPDFANRDLAPSRTIATGGIGAACAADTDCTEGTMSRVCWRSKILNNENGAAAPGGYCSAACTRDADCGAHNYCVSFAPMGGLFCVAGCDDGSTCRKPGYLCTYLDTVNACLPKLPQYTCDPKDSKPCTVTVAPMDPMSPRPGACVRQALDDGISGVCYPTCAAGDGCGSDAMGQDLACRFIDSIGSGDAFRGTLCMPISPRSASQGLGAPCSYADDCKAGLQCDSTYVTKAGPDMSSAATNRCLQLCRTGGGGPECPLGTICRDAFGTCGGAGLCRPR